jgi:transposase
VVTGWDPGHRLGFSGQNIFCAVLAWSRIRFVGFATDEKAENTLWPLANCVEAIGGVPKVVPADPMACVKAGVTATW